MKNKKSFFPRYKLYKDTMKRCKFKLDSAPNKIYFSNYSVSNDLSNELLGLIKKFYNIISSEPSFDKKFFCHNFRTLKIKVIKYDVNDELVSDSYYDCVNNCILINYHPKSNKSLESILFHTISSIYFEDKIYCGFKQAKNTSRVIDSFGDGINEGYTELLGMRYFENDNPSYSELISIVLFFERLIGYKKMQSLYSKADLLGFINILKFYDTEVNIKKIISCVDYIYMGFLKGACLNRKKTINCIEYIITKLLTWNLKRIEHLSVTGKLSNEEAFDEINFLYKNTNVLLNSFSVEIANYLKGLEIYRILEKKFMINNVSFNNNFQLK